MRIHLTKLPHAPGPVLRYRLGDLVLNELVGQPIRIEHTGHIACVQCGRDIKQTFGDGFCYPCFSSLARADSCIIKPHTCHYAQGTCREPAWGESHCLIPHVVYLAVTSGLKVGVTGAHKTAERWGDQGASQAVVLARTPDRRSAGLIEIALAQHLSDRTQWQKLVTGRSQEVDLPQAIDKTISHLSDEQRAMVSPNEPIQHLAYPVQAYPEKARSHRLDKAPLLEGTLHGIRGQYLLVGQVVFNVRRHSGFEIDFSHQANQTTGS